jgi:hypothetical protein
VNRTDGDAGGGARVVQAIKKICIYNSSRESTQLTTACSRSPLQARAVCATGCPSDSHLRTARPWCLHPLSTWECERKEGGEGGREGGRERQAVKGERSGVRDTVFIEGRRSATHSLHASTVVALRFSVVRCESRRASSFESLARAALDILLRGRPRRSVFAPTSWLQLVRFKLEAYFLFVIPRPCGPSPWQPHRQTRSATP